MEAWTILKSTCNVSFALLCLLEQPRTTQTPLLLMIDMISGVLRIMLVFWCFLLFSYGLCHFLFFFYCHLLLAVINKPGRGEMTRVFVNDFHFFFKNEQKTDLQEKKLGIPCLEGGFEWGPICACFM